MSLVKKLVGLRKKQVTQHACLISPPLGPRDKERGQLTEPKEGAVVSLL